MAIKNTVNALRPSAENEESCRVSWAIILCGFRHYERPPLTLRSHVIHDQSKTSIDYSSSEMKMTSALFAL